VTRTSSALLLLSLLGCTGSDNGAIQIVTDTDAGTFTRSPAPTELRVLAEAGDAGTVLATAQLPTSTIDLGQLSETADTVSIVIEGLDSSQTQRVFGASLPVQYGALAGQTIPVFVQRDGELARLPGPMPDAREAPTLALVQGEFLLIAGGTDATLARGTQLFDFGFLDTLSAPPALPVTPRSIALAGTVAWLIDDTAGEYFDFSSSGTASLTLPAGGTFADIAGGATVVDASGVQYIVGATRTTGDPTDKVLKVDPGDTSNTSYPYGNTTWLTLSAPRLGAAATWSTSYGLVVAGGSASAAGVEVVMMGSTSGAPLMQFPADATSGAGAAQLDAQHVVVAGGFTGLFQDPGVRSLDLGCNPTSTSCATSTSWGSLPVALGTAQAFAWGLADDALVVGNDLGGVTHVFRLGTAAAASGPTEIPTRVPHKNARALWSPVGSVVLFGGANMIESFVP
jgi:hypothetical protein